MDSFPSKLGSSRSRKFVLEVEGKGKNDIGKMVRPGRVDSQVSSRQYLHDISLESEYSGRIQRPRIERRILEEAERIDPRERARKAQETKRDFQTLLCMVSYCCYPPLLPISLSRLNEDQARSEERQPFKLQISQFSNCRSCQKP